MQITIEYSNSDYHFLPIKQKKIVIETIFIVCFCIFVVNISERKGLFYFRFLVILILYIFFSYKTKKLTED